LAKVGFIMKAPRPLLSFIFIVCAVLEVIAGVVLVFYIEITKSNSGLEIWSICGGLLGGLLFYGLAEMIYLVGETAYFTRLHYEFVVQPSPTGASATTEPAHDEGWRKTLSGR
jgi:hypothetical protein